MMASKFLTPCSFVSINMETTAELLQDLRSATDMIEKQATEIERLREKNRMPAHELDGAPQDEKLCRHCMDTGTCANGAVCKDCTAAWKKATERNTMEWVPRHPQSAHKQPADAAQSPSSAAD